MWGKRAAQGFPHEVAEERDEEADVHYVGEEGGPGFPVAKDGVDLVNGADKGVDAEKGRKDDQCPDPCRKAEVLHAERGQERQEDFLVKGPEELRVAHGKD